MLVPMGAVERHRRPFLVLGDGRPTRWVSHPGFPPSGLVAVILGRYIFLFLYLYIFYMYYTCVCIHRHGHRPIWWWWPRDQATIWRWWPSDQVTEGVWRTLWVTLWMESFFGVDGRSLEKFLSHFQNRHSVCVFSPVVTKNNLCSHVFTFFFCVHRKKVDTHETFAYVSVEDMSWLFDASRRKVSFGGC